MNIGEYIKQLRIAHGYSQEQLGKLLGVQRAAVQKWECGKVQNLKRETIKRLSEVFNVPPSSFFDDETENDTEARKALISDFQYKASVLHDCRTLTKGGSKVRCFYWDVKGSIEKLTANSVSIVSTILGTNKIAEQMGYLNDQNLTMIMQAFVGKYIQGKPMELYQNELKGVQAIDWQEFTADKDEVLLINGTEMKMSDSAFSDNIRELEEIVFE